MTEVVCVEERFPYGQFLAIASRNSDFTRRFTRAEVAPCTTSNRVAEIPYRASGIDDATVEVMMEQIGEPLYLGNALLGIWRCVNSDDSLYSHSKTELDRALIVEREVHRIFWSVPFLSEGLVSRIAKRIGCEDCSASGTGMPQASLRLAELKHILEKMSQGTTVEGDQLEFGITGLCRSGLAGIDPNLLVALSRASRGNLSATPSMQALLAALHEMNMQVESESAE